MCSNMHLTCVTRMALKTSQLDKLKDRLKRWKEVTMREFPDKPDLFLLTPDPDSINIDKLSDGGTITTDTCNAAKKVHRLLVEYIDGIVNEQDYMQHLRNVWINGVAKAVNKYLTEFLQEILEEISSFLRVSPDLEKLSQVLVDGFV